MAAASAVIVRSPRSERTRELKPKDDASLHSAGAIVRHRSPFADLSVPENDVALDDSFVAKWVVPFYSTVLPGDPFVADYKRVRREISVAIVMKLLGDVNWRPRTAAAYFATIELYRELEGPIGNLLLRSDVCYAGAEYCLALASFNSANAMDVLCRYLEYYLSQNDLWFDQASAMAAVAHLDAARGSNVLAKFIPKWESFVRNKPNWVLAKSIGSFEQKYASLRRVRESVVDA